MRWVTIIEWEQADALAREYLAQKYIVLVEEKLAVLVHVPHLHGGVIVGLSHAFRKRPRRATIDRLRRFHGQRLVRAHFVVLAAELVEGPLLHAPIGLGRRGCSLLQRAVHACVRARPFCSGWPASMRCGTMPSLIHHTESRDRPATAQEAKGGPLSERTARGSPNSRNAASEDRLHPRGVALVHRLAAQQITAQTIRDGQRIDALSVAGAHPAFEVAGPFVVGLLDRRKRLLIRFHAARFGR